MAKRSQQLFDYLRQIAANVKVAAEVFHEGLADLSYPERLAAKIKDLEHRGDELTTDLMNLLNATYITPLEREDFLALAVKLDDIVDGLEACSVRFDLYNVREATPAMRAFAAHILASVGEIAAAIEKLNARRLTDIREHTLRINRLEKEADETLRASLRELFQHASDPVALIKLKEVYEILESVTDKCEDVGDVLDSVIVKNA
ncbi:phosphate transport regulator [Alicyclobacillus cellulosilyticus]|uniref:Phosphate transport regulator n=1 Tax=Alicyclobacillus cellulosilyticus TaxID=1003997 RepID=A0A917NG19_9BACL|nr:DUF47 family protein [Alicyclobacillus cellulosilyticus]GGI98598.1 phosphate transport regulator [Alicyclobacillus cellulosilyticus]